MLHRCLGGFVRCHSLSLRLVSHRLQNFSEAVGRQYRPYSCLQSPLGGLLPPLKVFQPLLECRNMDRVRKSAARTISDTVQHDQAFQNRVPFRHELFVSCTAAVSDAEHQGAGNEYPKVSSCMPWSLLSPIPTSAIVRGGCHPSNSNSKSLAGKFFAD